MTLAVVLLAAGHGTRMNSKRQKVLHELGGKPMIWHVFTAAADVADLKPVLVVGPGETGARQLIGDDAEYVVQEKRLGTGHATLVTREALQGRADQVLVTYGDMPLLRPKTMQALARQQVESEAALSMLTVMGQPESTFGRVIRGGNGQVAEVIEVAVARQRDDAKAILNVRELNVGVYCFNAGWLWDNLKNLPLRKARNGQEYYLTDMVGLAVAQGLPVVATVLDDPDEGLGAGTRAELVEAEAALRRRVNNRWLDAGVTLVDPATTYIEADAVIGQDTIIWPNTYIQGHSVIGENCVLGPNAIVRDAHLGNGCRVEQAIVEGTTLDAGTVVPPFTHCKNEKGASS
ncbi:MAG TPA: NTP transferase domain-containing protein [Candidatus Sulfomarinibacteraceae bacterium]|nr:NTP transferase domain-containing protein [Candidatus Sulfomarinibacteraceae bacterium]